MADEQHEQQNLIYVSAQEAQAYAERVLQANGLTPTNATTVARGLVAADLRGIDTHGINRLPSYLTRIRQGVLNPHAEPTLHIKTPVAAQIDAHNNFGFIAAAQGIQHACTVAETYGIGMVSIKHSNHFGMSAHLCQTALDHPSGPMMSLVFTNSSPALPPYGGRSKLLGVSPIACGAPGGSNRPDFILDMAPSVAARGKIYKALRRGEKIPLDWALDATGAPTDDPAKALEDGAVMLPMGGPKGSALAIMMDVFSGVFSGAAFAGGVTGPYDPSRSADVGHFLVCIRPDLFMSREEFGERMDVLYERVTEGKRAQGVERIYMPGELEQITERKRREEGIPFVKGEVEGLNAEARRCGVEGLRVV
ncbi:Malate/L-lactate dehydrogenase [Hortaea werneckii]|nr:Malate/L-lactate dehydrogenase [Hortaea werneckii]